MPIFQNTKDDFRRIHSIIGGMRAHARSFTCYLKSCIPLRGSLQGDVFASIDHKGSYLSQVFHSLQVDFQNNLEHMGIW